MRGTQLPSNVVLLQSSPILDTHKQQHAFDSSPDKHKIDFLAYSPSFLHLLGNAPSVQNIAEKGYAFAHEAGVYDRSTNSVFFTANWQSSRDPCAIHSVHVETLQVTEHDFDSVVNGNGACQYKDGILFCAQGSITVPSALVHVNTASGPQTTLINHYQGKEFNSLNDVVVHHETGDVWFTDPIYGYEQTFRSRPQLPCLIYRFDPTTNDIVVVEDSLIKPNGLCFSPDYTRMYVTDTAAIQAHSGVPGDLSWDFTKPATIYVYDVRNRRELTNKRLFARIVCGVPDGIKCDAKGNVWTGCGDGIQVFSPLGQMIGKVLVAGGVANFNFAKGRIWAYNETRLIMVDLDGGVKGCLELLECD